MLTLSGAPAALADDLDQALHDADGAKTSNHDAFVVALAGLESKSPSMSLRQRQYLKYLVAWQTAYGGHYDEAMKALDELNTEEVDDTIKFRAGSTAVNILVFAKKFEAAFAELARVLALLPKITDGDAREQGLTVAAILYSQVGQYELAVNYAGMLVTENWAGRGSCKGGALKLQARYRMHQLTLADPEIDTVLAACKAISEPIYLGVVRNYQARMLIDESRYGDAIRLLDETYDVVRASRYPRIVSELESLLAKAYLQSTDPARAREHALAAIDLGARGEITEAYVDGLYVMYQVSRQQGDVAAALDYHQRYAEADKGYLNDASAARLAFQMAEHQAIANRYQIESLAKQNELLTLQRELDQKAVVNSRLWLALALAFALFLVFWALRTKRLQMHFQRLAQRDGLTGIANRQHFFEEATRLLAYNAKSSRDAALVILDLDHFKAVNDNHGHPTGDVVLKRVVADCVAELRSVDLFGRLGGEEFVVMLPECDAATGAAIAERLRLAIAAITGGGIDFPVSASFGLTDTARSGHTLRQMIIDADHALYRAKAGGRNRVVVFEPPSRTAELARAG